MIKVKNGQTVNIFNKSKHSVLSSKCRIASSYLSRLIGLMGTKTLDADEGLLIDPCNSIHMFFMKYPLDIIFIDKNWTVVKTIENIKPWSASPIIKHSHYVLEVPAGTISKCKTAAGDILSIEII